MTARKGRLGQERKDSEERTARKIRLARLRKKGQRKKERRGKDC